MEWVECLVEQLVGALCANPASSRRLQVFKDSEKRRHGGKPKQTREESRNRGLPEPGSQGTVESNESFRMKSLKPKLLSDLKSSGRGNGCPSLWTPCERLALS